MAGLNTNYVKILARKNHRDGSVDLSVKIESSFDPDEGNWLQAEPITQRFPAPPSLPRSGKLAVVARLKKAETQFVFQAPNGGWRSDDRSIDFARPDEQTVLERLVTTGAYCIICTEEPLSYRPFTPLSWICLVSVSPSMPILNILIEKAGELPIHSVSTLLTPNPLNFPRNIRSAPPSLTPRAPSAEPLFPLQTGLKEHARLLVGGGHRLRLKPPKPDMLEALDKAFRESQPRELKSLHLVRSIPHEAPANFDNVSPSAPSVRGTHTREQYMYDKKLPQIYSLLTVITPFLKENPLRILDVGGGRGDLARNVLWYAETFLNRWNDEITIVDRNPNCPQPKHERISLVICDFNAYEPEESYDVTIALHACGNLTDLIMNRAVHWSRKAIVVVPCCYGKISPPHVLNSLAERNQQPEICEMAMHVINERRLLSLDQSWVWEMYKFPRSFSAKNIVVLGTKA